MDENREIIRYLLDLLRICNLKKLKYQKLTSMSIFCIIEIFFISKETMGGLAHSSESNMSESYAIKHWQLSFCFYFSLNRLGKTSSRPVWDHPDASSKRVPELTSLFYLCLVFISSQICFPTFLTISGLLGSTMCPTNQRNQTQHYLEPLMPLLFPLWRSDSQW